ncbi:MAG: APC family permease [Acidimicrobiales bacterium]
MAKDPPSEPNGSQRPRSGYGYQTGSTGHGSTGPGSEEQGNADARDLQTFGYRQELRRSLKFFSSFAAAFSYISPSTGIFTLFSLGIATIGGVFFWSWPIVAVGQFLVALVFAELSGHYPVAGSVFQWTKYLSGRTYSWFSGWIYLIAGILTTTAVVVTLPLALIPALDGIGAGIPNTLASQRTAALVILVVITVLNVVGVRIVTMINNTGVLFEVLGMVVFALVLLAFHHHQGIGVVVSSGGQPVNFGSFFAAMFMSLFVIYGFDTASTLAEETKDPRRQAPKAVLASVAGAFVIGSVFLLATLIAVPNLHTAIAKGYGPAQIIAADLPSGLATTYLLVVSAAIFVCCLAIDAATIRLVFGMARDGRLPGSRWLAQVEPRVKTPVIAAVVVGVATGIPLLQYAGAGYIAIAATGMIYFAYMMCNVAVLRARLAGRWPPTSKGTFSLGRFGLPVTVAALVWGLAMLVNFAWPRAASNPTPKQTGYLLNFHLAWLNQVPVLWTVFAAVLVVGAVYYFGWAGRQPGPEAAGVAAGIAVPKAGPGAAPGVVPTAAPHVDLGAEGVE